MFKLVFTILGTIGAFVVASYFAYQTYDDKTSLDGIKLILASGATAGVVSAFAYFFLSF